MITSNANKLLAASYQVKSAHIALMTRRLMKFAHSAWRCVTDSYANLLSIFPSCCCCCCCCALAVARLTVDQIPTEFYQIVVQTDPNWVTSNHGFSGARERQGASKWEFLTTSNAGCVCLWGINGCWCTVLRSWEPNCGFTIIMISITIKAGNTSRL